MAALAKGCFQVCHLHVKNGLLVCFLDFMFMTGIGLAMIMAQGAKEHTGAQMHVQSFSHYVLHNSI